MSGKWIPVERPEMDCGIAYDPVLRRAKLIAMTAKGRAALRQIETRQAVWADRVGTAIGLRHLKAAVEGLRRARLRLEEDETSPDG